MPFAMTDFVLFVADESQKVDRHVAALKTYRVLLRIRISSVELRAKVFPA